MQSPNGQPLPTAMPGQYVVVHLQPAAGGPPLFRSYSLSGSLSTERFRISVKIEPNGAAGTWLREHIRVGDTLEVSSPRGSFTLESGERPVVLLSAGIGATPVLAMLHALAAVRSARQVLWLHAARDREHHPFAAEVRRLMLAFPHGRSYVCYSKPAPVCCNRHSFGRAGRRASGGGPRRQRDDARDLEPRAAIGLAGPAGQPPTHAASPAPVSPRSRR